MDKQETVKTQQACTVHGQWSWRMGASLCCSSTSEEPPTTTVPISNASAKTSSVQETWRGSLLVFVNPHSGAGKSLDVFLKKVGPRLTRNRILYELVVTTGRDHAKSIVRSRPDIATFNGILILSGDGLIYEVLNGIAGRTDFVQLLPNLPLSIVPSGSGNGLLSSVLAHHGKSLDKKKVMSAAVEIATNPVARAEAISLFHCETDKSHILSFLSFGWGIMADIDIESEKWRKTLGSNRFTVGAIARSINLRKYRGRLSFKLYTHSDLFHHGERYDVYDRTPAQRIEMIHEPDMHPDAKPVSAESGISAQQWKTLHCHPQTPSIQEPIDETWITIEDDFIGIYATTLSHISPDGPFMPLAQLDDDRIHLTYILKSDISSRFDVIKFLTAIESHKHLDLNFCKTVEVSSFRFEALSEGSYFVIDGEVVDTTAIQVTSTILKTALFSV